MAEDKRSFVLYADMIHTVRKLPKMKQADLFMTILRYVNDENPEVTDTLVSVAFEPIKQQLKRDLKNWDKTRKKKSDGGALGNLKRWNPDLFEKVQNKELSLEESLKIASDRIAIKNIAPVAVNVNDNVNVNVINKGSDSVRKVAEEHQTKMILVPQMLIEFKKHIPTYPESIDMDNPALFKIATFIGKQIGITNPINQVKEVLVVWKVLCELIRDDDFYCTKPLSTIANKIQGIYQKQFSETKKIVQTVDVAAARFSEEDRTWKALNGG